MSCVLQHCSSFKTKVRPFSTSSFQFALTGGNESFQPQLKTLPGNGVVRIIRGLAIFKNGRPRPKMLRTDDVLRRPDGLLEPDEALPLPSWEFFSCVMSGIRRKYSARPFGQRGIIHSPALAWVSHSLHLLESASLFSYCTRKFYGTVHTKHMLGGLHLGATRHVRTHGNSHQGAIRTVRALSVSQTWRYCNSIELGTYFRLRLTLNSHRALNAKDRRIYREVVTADIIR